MKIQDSIRACHASSLFVSVLANGLLVLLLLTLIKPPSEPPPSEFQVMRVKEEPGPDIKVPPEIHPDDATATRDLPPEIPPIKLPSDDIPEPSVDAQAPVTPAPPLFTLPPGFLVEDGLVPSPRTDRGREDILKKLGPVGEQSDDAVVRALVWLESRQRGDGSWSLKGTESDAANAGMTGLAVLTFLSHGETPSSKRFGPCVTDGLRFLVSRQDAEGIYRPAGAHTAYGHAIATYAVAEAYAMTRNPLLRDSLERAVSVIVAGQLPAGGFDYDYRRGDRNDLSLSAWQVQALKAATLSGAGGSRVEVALGRALDGMLEGSTDGAGGRTFCYTVQAGKRGGGERNIITAAAGLALQYAGRAGDRETRETFRYLSRFAERGRLPEWGAARSGSEHGGEIMFWYYLAQAFYQEDPEGPACRRFLPAMVSALTENQSVDGHWDCFTANGAKHGPVYNTTLAALGLMFYRNNHLATAGQPPIAKPVKTVEENVVVFEI